MSNYHSISEEECNEIDRYLNGYMSPEEATAFEIRMGADAVLSHKVEELRLVMLAVGETALQQRMNDYHANIPSIPRSTKAVSFRLAWWLAASVILAVSIGILTLRYLQSPTRLYEQYYQPDPGLMTTMGEGSGNYDFERAMVDYKTGAYPKAYNVWSHLLKKAPGNDTLQYFTAAAAQAMSQYDTAIRYYELVAANLGSAFSKEACWYLGLAYLRKDEKGKAIHYLQRSEQTRARTIIDKLK